MVELVGRERELQLLRSAFDHACQGEGALMLVSGEAGIGKTTLTRTLIELATRQDAIVLGGACYDLSATPPYGVWLDLIRHYQRIDDLMPLPSFMVDGEELQRLGGPEILHARSAEFFSELAKYRPVVMVLEDLHWADQSSLEFLRYFARIAPSHPILIVATYRGDEIALGHPLFTLLPMIIRETRAERIELRPLDLDSIRDIVDGEYALPLEQREMLSRYLDRRTEGNPLFVHETLRTLEMDGILRTERGLWSVRDLQRATVPNLVRQMIESRLDAMDERSVEAIQMASVIGHTVPLNIWETFFEPETLGTALSEATTRGLVHESPDASGVVFPHAIVREAIHEAIPLHRRRMLHRQLGELIMTQRRADPEAVAYHFTQAGDARSAEWLIAAGEQAERRFAWDEASSRYREAIDILEMSYGQESVIAGLWMKAARLLRFTDPETANTYLETAMTVADEGDDRVIAAAAQFNHGNNLCNLGALRSGLSEMTRSIEILVAHPEEAERISRWSQTSLAARADPVQAWLGSLALMLSTIGRFNEAIETAERSLRQRWEDIRDTVPAELIAAGTHSALDAYEAIATAHAALGNPDEARLAFYLSHEIHKRLNYGPLRVLVANLELLMSHFPFQTDDLIERRSLAKIIEDHLDLSSGMVGNQNATWGYEHLLLREGRWSELQTLIDTAPESTSHDYRVVSLLARARLAWYQGDYRRAAELVYTLLPSGPDSSPDDDIHLLTAEPHRIAASMAIEQGELESARNWLAAHDTWFEWTNAVIGRADGMLLWARLRFAEGEYQEALPLANQSLKLASEPAQPMALIAIYRLLAELALTSGERESAHRLLQKSLNLASACTMPFERALSCLSLAELEIERDDHVSARSYLSSVRQICEPIGAQPALSRASTLAAKLEEPAEPLRFNLTPREMDVLRLLTRGMQDKDIADELFISRHTVMRHVSHILAKLDVDSRTAAAAKAVRERLC